MTTSEAIEKDIILKIEDELLNAMKNCDVAKLDKLLHDELLFNIPNGQTITKAIDLDNYGSGNMAIDEITASEQTINLIDDTAIVTVVIDMKGKYFDYALDGKYKIIRVWKLFGAHLKVIAGSSIKLEEHNN